MTIFLCLVWVSLYFSHVLQACTVAHVPVYLQSNSTVSNEAFKEGTMYNGNRWYNQYTQREEISKGTTVCTGVLCTVHNIVANIKK